MTLNLLPWRQRREILLRKELIFYIFINLGILICVFSTARSYLKNQIIKVNLNINSIRKASHHLTAHRDFLERTLKDARYYQSIVISKYKAQSLFTVLYFLCELLPENIYITLITFERNVLRAEGVVQSFSQDSLMFFIKAFQSKIKKPCKIENIKLEHQRKISFRMIIDFG